MFGQQAKVAAVRSRPHVDRAIAGCDLVGGTHPLDQVAVRREATGRELSAPPLHLDGVIAQPLIAGAGLGHGRFQGCSGGVDRLAERHAEATLGHQQIGHRRRPIASVDGADRQRVGERPARRQRIDRLVASSLERGERLPHRPELLDRADPFGATGCVGRTPMDHEPEGQRSGVRRHQVQARRFRDHARVGTPPTAQHGERPEAAVLLSLHRGDEDVATKLHPGVSDRLQRAQRGDESGLHVTRAPTEHGASGDARARRGRPTRRPDRRSVRHRRGR